MGTGDPTAPYGYGGAPVSSNRDGGGLAIASLVLGILGFFTWILAVGAIVCASMARSRIAANGGVGRSGIALAGLVLGIVGLVLGVIWLVWFSLVTL
jgi:hypothetical protein